MSTTTPERRSTASTETTAIRPDRVYYDPHRDCLVVRHSGDTAWVELHPLGDGRGWRLDSDIPEPVRSTYIHTHRGTFSPVSGPSIVVADLQLLPIGPEEADPHTVYLAVIVDRSTGATDASGRVMAAQVHPEGGYVWRAYDVDTQTFDRMAPNAHVAVIGVYAHGEQGLAPVTLTDTDLLAEARATVDRLQAEVTRLQAEVRARQRDVLAAEERGTRVERERIRELLIAEGERRDWCDELDDFLEQCGMERRTQEYEVEVSFTFTQRVSVTASSEDEARDQVDSDINASVRIDPFGSLSPHDEYVDLEYQIDDVTLADS